ncbi:hypothetical protein ACF0H5_009047 [Mactra antiquata]
MIANRRKCLRGVIIGFVFASTVWMIALMKKSYGSRYFETRMRNTSEKFHVETMETWNPNITVITAYFDLGTFPKGNLGTHYTRDMYFNWATTFKFLRNPIVVYTDSETFKQHMYTLRQGLMNMTKIFLIKRSTSWAFKNIDKIRALFSSYNYPKHYPNTVIAEYACAQHAKYDVVARAAEQECFGTKYYMWLDIGYFRDRVNKKRSFRFLEPEDFDENRIAMTRIYSDHHLNVTPKTIFLNNLVYVGGGLVFGKKQQIVKFASQVKQTVNYFLEQNLTNTDQQVIYAMFSKEGQKVIKPEVKLQCYKPPTDQNWFYLGNKMTSK